MDSLIEFRDELEDSLMRIGEETLVYVSYVEAWCKKLYDGLPPINTILFYLIVVVLIMTVFAYTKMASTLLQLVSEVSRLSRITKDLIVEANIELEYQKRASSVHG